MEEENYFFKLSNYQTYLEEYLSKEGVVVPEWRRLEAQSFVQKGLFDFSISREKARLNWGIPVPGDEEQVMYVWFDALTNYISTLGWPEDALGNYTKFWEGGEPVQVAGKDQVRFQSIMWQAMLRSAGLAPSHCVAYHGFINSGGQKMSKSLGNVISPFELIAKYGTDATRYLLLRHVHPFEDTDITWDRLDEWYTANLVNGLGNLTSRILKMSETYGVALTEIEQATPQIEGSELQQYLDGVWAKIAELDGFIQKEEPFKKIKVDEVAAKSDVTHLLVALARIAQELAPALPQTAEIILGAIRENKKPENLFARLA